MSNSNSREHEIIYTQRVKAGRRTYFFDVKETRAGDYYLTITESQKFSQEDGSFNFRKNKIYLYKEDFAEFRNQMDDSINFIIENKGEIVISDRHQDDFVKPVREVASNESHELDTNAEIKVEVNTEEPTKGTETFTDVNFEDI
jgi:hypothetical protein